MKIGFIGTGNMGNPMAANLIRAGHQLTVHDLRREAATNLLEMGADWADSPRGAVPGNDAVLTSLPVPRDVEAVVLGEGGILEGASSGTVIFDLSTNSPTVVRRLHETCAERGVTLLDSPVSGGTYGAAAGTLAVMVGGDRATFDRFEATLSAVGSHVVYCGDIGAGSVCKICNNLMSMGIGVLLSEALTLGVKAGVDLGTLADVIAHSSGSSRRLTEKFARFLFQGNFVPGQLRTGIRDRSGSKGRSLGHGSWSRVRCSDGPIEPGGPEARGGHVPRLRARGLRRGGPNPGREGRRAVAPGRLANPG